MFLTITAYEAGQIKTAHIIPIPRRDYIGHL